MDNKTISEIESLGDEHQGSKLNIPLRVDAFEMDDDLKIELIAKHFKEIMHIMGLDLTDESLSGTPYRVAKMYIKEQFKGLSPENKPAPTLFENNFKYQEMLVEKDISFFSTCEHHFVPIYGKAHLAYISSGKVIGLSKLNRIVDYYSKRPQVQERLTVEIAKELKAVLQTDDVAVVLDAKHLCVASRGIKDTSSATVTASYSGKFNDPATRAELFKYIGMEPDK
ncbi:MAG: GTP cyclohydrolase I FolE [Bacteroidia bacterium]|jgi:GTP cyclohydrolase I|nr:GTP cyclohydrolase I FolE [Bacteroidia bacterium]